MAESLRAPEKGHPLTEEANMAEENTFSAKQVASRIGTDSKTLRKFFRDPDTGYSAVGQGGRYEFPESELPKIKAAFDDWNAGKTRRNRTPSATSGTRQPSRGRVSAPSNPLERDDLQTRTKYSIAQRAELHGVTAQGNRWVPKPPTPNRAPVPRQRPQHHDDLTSTSNSVLDLDLNPTAEDLEALEGELDDLDIEEL